MISNETLQAIKTRRSNRNFRDEQITDEELQAVLEAGMYAPNAGDEAWHFTVVQNWEMLHRLNAAAKETARQLDIEQIRELGNNERFDCLYSAPTLVIVSGDANAPMPLDADCAAATENMLIAAESIGLGSCWIFFTLLAFASEQGTALREELKIPDGYKLFSSIALGYKQNGTVKAPERKPDLITYIR